MSDRKAVVNFLREVNGLFDCGCEISVDDDGFSVVGRDYYYDAGGYRPNIFVERMYEAAFEFDEEGQEYKDTLSELIADIKATNERLQKEYDEREAARIAASGTRACCCADKDAAK